MSLIPFCFIQGMGLVSTAFPPEALQKLRHGTLGICHTRYSTTGVSELQNCQPFVVDTMHGKVAVAHNGELVNAQALRKKVSRVSVTGRVPVGGPSCLPTWSPEHGTSTRQDVCSVCGP